MLQLQQEKALFTERKIKVVVVVPENQAKLEKYLASENLDFSFVPDPTHKIADKYQQAVKILKLGRMPAQIVLDKDLNKVYQHYANSMADIVHETEIIKNLKAGQDEK